MPEQRFLTHLGVNLALLRRNTVDLEPGPVHRRRLRLLDGEVARLHPLQLRAVGALLFGGQAVFDHLEREREGGREMVGSQRLFSKSTVPNGTALKCVSETLHIHIIFIFISK